MSNLSKLLSALWGILGFIALFTLFIIYMNFPEHVDLNFLKLDNDLTIDRQLFFTIFAGGYLLVNLIVLLSIKAANALKNVSEQLHLPQQLRLMVGLKVLVCGANTFLIALMIVSKAALDAQSLPDSWQWAVLSLGSFIMLGGLIYLLFVLINPLKSPESLH